MFFHDRIFPNSYLNPATPKTLDIRLHQCQECGYTTTRDVAASQEIRNRGLSALGHSVLENVCGLDATGSIGNGILVGTGRSRKSKLQDLESPVTAMLGA